MGAQSRVTSRCDVAHSGRENLHQFLPILLQGMLSLVVSWLCDQDLTFNLMKIGTADEFPWPPHLPPRGPHPPVPRWGRAKEAARGKLPPPRPPTQIFWNRRRKSSESPCARSCPGDHLCKRESLCYKFYFWNCITRFYAFIKSMKNIIENKQVTSEASNMFTCISEVCWPFAAHHGPDGEPAVFEVQVLVNPFLAYCALRGKKLSVHF